MKTFTIYGASDDLVETAGVKGCDEFNVYPKGLHAWTGLLWSASEKQGFKLHAIYDGCWSFAVGMTDEDEPVPDWPIKIEWDEYSQQLIITVPDDAELIVDEEDQT